MELHRLAEECVAVSDRCSDAEAVTKLVEAANVLLELSYNEATEDIDREGGYLFVPRRSLIVSTI
jgi:hypothetical protein